MLVLNAWESEFFKRKIYGLDVAKWDARTFRDEVNTCKPDLIAAKVSVGNSALLQELIINGFCIEEVAVDFTRYTTGDDLVQDCAFEIATTDQIGVLKGIASESLVYSRFNNEVFGPYARQNLYETWVTKAVAGQFDDVCLVVRSGDEVAGFITCRSVDDHVCRVGLLVVKPSCQGMGFGGLLLQAACGYAADKGNKVIRITTQYVNKPAMSLYAKHGFDIDSVDMWLYLT